ncbi:hypothetical protein AB0K49_01570 [Streptomyces decoyicus]|uniref:hypothetical protein n=1 Tax=Streptomyces decoyicus TaxID=249567 RepID=UPI00345D6300
MLPSPLYEAPLPYTHLALDLVVHQLPGPLRGSQHTPGSERAWCPGFWTARTGCSQQL